MTGLDAILARVAQAQALGGPATVTAYTGAGHTVRGVLLRYSVPGAPDLRAQVAGILADLPPNAEICVTVPPNGPPQVAVQHYQALAEGTR